MYVIARLTEKKIGCANASHHKCHAIDHLRHRCDEKNVKRGNGSMWAITCLIAAHIGRNIAHSSYAAQSIQHGRIKFAINECPILRYNYSHPQMGQVFFPCRLFEYNRKEKNVGIHGQAVTNNTACQSIRSTFAAHFQFDLVSTKKIVSMKNSIVVWNSSSGITTQQYVYYMYKRVQVEATATAV
ncbi:hypothetical protein OUZ56_001004 [Daphnia magna]|uniref:Uncharacterized protein n=1 Tax=Daphnia magna TaxID=35525 RepID=A0ABR0A201_9CRUS|nr:hypothetical protein OUZ56_001004 [Daphnia magna]